MNDIITKDQVLTAYNNAPEFIRAAFNDEATTQIIVGLQTRFQLQANSAGTLGKEVGYLILGLINPDKFTNRLKNTGFPEQVVTEVAKEITQKIFAPLRAQMGPETLAVPEPTRVEEPAKLVMPQTAPRVPVQEIDRTYMSPTPANPMLPRRPDMNQPADIKWIRPPQKVTIPPPNYTPTPIKREIPRPSPKAPEMLAKPAINEKLLEDHEEPHLNIGVSNKVQGVSPIPVPARTAPPPPNLPGVISKVQSPPTQPPPVLPKVAPQIPVSAEPKPATPVPPAKPYASDPYREPIE